MAASIRLAANADFSTSGLGMLMPANDIQVFSYFGGSAENSVINYAPGGVNHVVVGAPTFSANYITCKAWQNGEGYLRTDTSESSSLTVGIVVEPVNEVTSSTRAAIFGNLNNAGSGGFSGIGLSMEEISTGNPDKRMRFALGNNANRKSITLNTTNIYRPMFWVASVVSGGRMALRNMTEGTITEGVDDRATPLSNASKLCIGSALNGLGMDGYSNVYAAVIAPRELSESDIEVMYRQIQRAMASRGVSI